MRDILIGNICSIFAMITDSVSGTRKKRSQILGIQIISQFFYGAGAIILKGYSGTAQNVVAVFRNLAAMKEIKSKVLEWVLIGLGVVLGIVFNNRGLIGWLPIVANFEYSVAMFRFRGKEKLLKVAFIVNMLLFVVFSFAIKNYVGTAGNLVVAVTTAVSLIKEARQNKECAGGDGNAESVVKQETMDNRIIIRPERPEDFRTVEELVRESFWNVYRPGCSEHYVLHVLRDDPAFVKELDFVMEKDGRMIGQNMFMRTVIEADDGSTVNVLTMGPICIAPELKRKGYGKILLDHTLEKAADMGFGAVLFEGNIDFYGKSGFGFARKFGIRYHDLPEDADDSFFLCKELIPGYLDGITGVYQTPQGYYVDEAEVQEFDKSFPPKKKEKLPGQLFDAPLD